MRSAAPALLLLAVGCGGSPPPAAPPAPAPSPVAIPVPPPPPLVPAPEGDDRLPFEKEADPVVARSLREFENLRLDPSLQGHRLRIFGFRPFIVAVEESGPGKAEAAAAKAGEALTAAYTAFRAMLKDLAGLDPPLLEDVGDERIRVVLLSDDASFDRWHRESGRERSPNVKAYYRRDGDRRIFASLQDLLPRNLGRLAAFALLHQYQRHFVQADDDAIARKDGMPIEVVQWDDNRFHSSYSWLERALASRVGRLAEGGAAAGSGDPDGLYAEDLERLRSARKRGLAWEVEEFLFADQGQVKARAAEKANMEWETLLSVHEAQSRILFRTLLEGEEGRWREGLGRLLRNLVEGKSGQIYLLESFGLPKRPKDPKVTAWIAEVEAACLRTEEALLAKAGK